MYCVYFNLSSSCVVLLLSDGLAVPPVCVQSKEVPDFGESYAEDLPTFSLSPQEYITNVSKI